MELSARAASSPSSGWHPAQTRHGLHVRLGAWGLSHGGHGQGLVPGPRAAGSHRNRPHLLLPPVLACRANYFYEPDRVNKGDDIPALGAYIPGVEEADRYKVGSREKLDGPASLGEKGPEPAGAPARTASALVLWSLHLPPGRGRGRKGSGSRRRLGGGDLRANGQLCGACVVSED